MLRLLVATIGIGIGIVAALATPFAHAQNVQASGAPIDMGGYLVTSREAARHRSTHLITEQEFLRMAAEPGTIVLDARSTQKYDLLHVKGAINLSFPDIDIESLKKAIPDTSTRILIYCNNNFSNAERAFPSKLPTASLNLSTYIALYTYGYRNVYELDAYVDANASQLPLVTGR